MYLFHFVNIIDFWDETKLALLLAEICWGRGWSRNLPHQVWYTHPLLATSTPGRCLEMQTLRPQPGFLLQNLHLSMVPRGSLSTLSVRNTPQSNLFLDFFHLSSNFLLRFCPGISPGFLSEQFLVSPLACCCFREQISGTRAPSSLPSWLIFLQLCLPSF